MSRPMMSLEQIRAKLAEFKNRPPVKQPEQDDNDMEEGNSFDSPMSTQHSELDLPSGSAQTTANSLHLPERETDLFSQHSGNTNTNTSLQLSGFSLLAQPPSALLQSQKPNPPTKSRSLQVPGMTTAGAGSVLNTSRTGYTDTQLGTGSEGMTGDKGAREYQHTHPSSASKHHSLRHFSSTPSMSIHTPSSTLLSQVKIKNMGLPKRVRLQNHPVNQLSNDKEDDTDFVNFIKPIQPTPQGSAAGHNRGRFASMASSGFISDLSPTTEMSMPDLPPTLSDHRSLCMPPTLSDHRSLSLPPPPALSSTVDHLHASSKPVSSQNKGPTSSQPQPVPTPLPSAAVAPPPQPLPPPQPPAPSSLHSQKQVSRVSLQQPVAAGLPSSTPVPPPQARGVVTAVSTPDKGLQLQSAAMHTPSGEALTSVTVNGEQYSVLKKVGRGGSAKVYMVLDAEKNIRALKVVELEDLGPQVVEGFRNEIRLLQRLQYCPSVIKMFNFEMNASCLFVVLEFGLTDLAGFFDKRAKQGQGLDPTLIKFYWKEMLQAVHALHKEGVIHSDLKPANFMLVAGNIKLIDFGIANTLQQDKTSILKDSRLGTPSYMSPEAIMATCEEDDNDADDHHNDEDAIDKENHRKQQQRKSQPKFKVGVRSDVWSLGCILYNMVYGRTPFQHIRNNLAKLQAITNPSVPIKFPPLPTPDHHLTDVLQKCLNRDVKSRPTCGELLAHPYLVMNQETDAGDSSRSHTPPPHSDAESSCPSSLDSRRVQEVLSSQLAVGSPNTRAVLGRVMSMMQQMGKK